MLKRCHSFFIFTITVLLIFTIFSLHHTTNLNLFYYEPIKDLQSIPQNSEWIDIKNSNIDNYSLTAVKASFKKDFYSIWDQNKLSYTKVEIEKVVLDHKDNSFGENLQKRPDDWFTQQLNNSNLDSLEAVNKPAIILKNTNLRGLPTLLPCFDNPLSAGEGYPFDYLQYDLLPLGSPVLVSHFSKDLAWVLVETNSGSHGWVLASDIGFVSRKQINEIKKKSLAVLTEDQQPLYLNDHGSRYKKFVSYSLVGTILPINKIYKNTISLKIPFLIPNTAKIIFRTIIVPKSLVLSKPLSLNKIKDLKFAISKFIGKSYSWGNLYHYGSRDCSGMIRNFYSLFYILLPRNSYRQINNCLDPIDLSQHRPKDKLKILITQSKPFKTLLYCKGHIGIYVGTFNNQPIMFHSVWGVRLTNGQKQSRALIGRTVFSSLEYGKELPFFDHKKGNFLNKMQKIGNIL